MIVFFEWIFVIVKEEKVDFFQETVACAGLCLALEDAPLSIPITTFDFIGAGMGSSVPNKTGLISISRAENICAHSYGKARFFYFYIF